LVIMQNKNVPNYDPSPTKFIRDIFKANAYFTGRSLKRSQLSVERWASEEAMIQAAKDRGLRLLRFNNEYVFLDGLGEIEWLVP
jgi:hypothetical protein